MFPFIKMLSLYCTMMGYFPYQELFLYHRSVNTNDTEIFKEQAVMSYSN
jgi:hypothetical protein